MPSMSAVDPSQDSNRRAADTSAAPFAVDFEGVRETFEDGDGGGGVKGVPSVRSVAGAGMAALAPLVVGAAEASAKGGEFGIIEGRTASFFHPIIMVSCSCCTEPPPPPPPPRLCLRGAESPLGRRWGRSA